MQSLALPRPSSLFSAPFGRPVEPDDALAKLQTKFSPTRPEQHSYPSPPMSEPQSPTRRLAQTNQPARLPYSLPVSVLERTDAGSPLPPPSSSHYDARSAVGIYNHTQQRPLYPDPQHRDPALHYQQGRPAEHVSYGNVPVSQAYGYGYSAAAMSSYPGAQHTGPVLQQATMIAPPPARPNKPARRTKAHVASACVNCKKAHLSCDVQRPCGRCVASGKQESCKDVQHKKRGRPRLRDDREFTRPEERRPSEQALGALPTSEVFVHQSQFATPIPRQSPESIRALGSIGSASNISIPHLHTTPLPNGGHTSVVGGQMSGPTSLYPAGPILAYQSIPVAFLNLDLIIQKSNQAFSELVAFLGVVQGKHLGELLEARQHESLQRLRNELRDERVEREPTYMAPITPIGYDPMRAVMEAVTDQDVDQVSQGFTDRPMFLSFRLPNGQFQSLQVQIRLAKSSLYFATLVVRSPSRYAAPPSTKQLAPPTPMSLPANAAVAQYTPQQSRNNSVVSSAPSSPYFNFSSVRTSLPAVSPSSYSSSPSYGYSPTAGVDSSYFPTIQPPSKPAPGGYQGPYGPLSRRPSGTPTPLRELNRPARLEGLHLPPIRGPAPLGSPLHLETSHGGPRRESDVVRQRESFSSTEQRRADTPDSSKRRRLDIHEVLG